MNRSKIITVITLAVSALCISAYFLRNESGNKEKIIEQEKARLKKEEQNNALVMAGPRVTHHKRENLTVWIIDVPKQFRSGSYVFWERCIAAATPVGRLAISCEGHHASEAINDLDLNEDLPLDEPRGR